nr:SAGA-associated factor 29 homolog A-like isoform X1 [Nicotiana tomentosiformis]
MSQGSCSSQIRCRCGIIANHFTSTTPLNSGRRFYKCLKPKVTARVAQEDGEKDEWVIVKVTHYDKETKEFEVLDEEPGEDEEGGAHR